MKFNSMSWDNQSFAKSEEYAALIDKLYKQLLKDAAALALTVNFNTDKPFSFANYPALRNKVNKLFAKYATQTEIIISNATKELWQLANDKNNALVGSIGEKYKEIQKAYSGYGAANAKALEEFQKRVEGGLNLSDRVWRNTQQARQEIEMAIDIGIRDGASASTLSRMVRTQLNEPDKLFRRVRDEHGQLHLSKNAKSYHPGQGVYRSSYKNAMRLVRTETNTAYRAADFNRWSTMDFVAGIEVRLSNNPNHCPVCEALQGKYPKDFKFIGWHPQCRCFAIPALISDKQFNDLELMQLNGEDTSSFVPNNQVSDINNNAKKWFDENKKRVSNYNTLPNFISDNQQYFGLV